MSEKTSETMARLRQQLGGMMDRGLEGLAVEPKGGGESPEPGLIEPEEVRMIPTQWGMRPADAPSRLSVDITEGERYDFRLLAKREGMAIREAVRAYIRACVEADRIITVEETE